MHERDLFIAALEIDDQTARRAYLDESCVGDPALRVRIEKLLNRAAEAGDFLEQPAADLCSDMDAGLLTEANEPPPIGGDPPTMIGQADDTAQTILVNAVPTGDSPAAVALPSGSTESSSVFGTLFGRYQVERVLGSGGMGIVYLAEDLRLGRRVALKIPKFDADGKFNLIERFRREARTMASVLHRNLCPIFDVDEQDGTHYLTMAFIDGESLSQVIKQGAPFTTRQIADLIRKLALALDAAHRAGVIHRDLKPANVMIDRAGEPILMDFGLAWMAHETDARVTQSGAVVGTPAYMSPEQAEGDPNKVGAASDIYSLGAILYELIAGRPIHTGSVTRVLIKLMHEAPARPSDFRGDVDPKLEEICWKAISRRPQDRFATAAEFATSLASFLDRRQTDTSDVIPLEMDLDRSSTQVVLSGKTDVLPQDECTDTIVYRTPGEPEGVSPRTAAVVRGLTPSGSPSSMASRSKSRIVLASVLLIGVLGSVWAIVANRTKPSGDGIVKSQQQTPDVDGNTSAVESPTASAQTAVADHALLFDGSTAHVNLPIGHTDSRPITIEAAVIPEESSATGNAGQAIVANNQSHGLSLDIDNQRFNFLMGVGTKYMRASSTDTARAGQPTRLAAVFDGQELRLFVDGKLAARRPIEGAYKPAPFNLILGARPNVGKTLDSRFRGTIDEVRISKMARYSADYAPTLRLESDADTLALYHFDEGSGNELKDSSGNHYHGQIVGAKWVRADGAAISPPSTLSPETNALKFDGAGVVQVPSFQFDGKPPVTLEAWVTSLVSDDEHPHIVTIGPSDGVEFKLKTSQRYWNSVLIDQARPSEFQQSRGLATVGRRVHVAGVWDGLQVRLYIDGRASPSARSRLQVRSGAGLTIGDESLVGIIDEVRVSNSVRYASDFTPQPRFESDANTLVLYHFDEGQGDKLIDSSGNNHHGKIAGAKWVKADGSARVEPSVSLHFTLSDQSLGRSGAGKPLAQDFDGDGDLDLLLCQVKAPNGTGRFVLFVNNGQAQFTERVIMDDGQGGFGVAGDLDGDGDMDVLVPSQMRQNAVLINDGAGMFRHQPLGTSEKTQSAALGDLDGDGDLDVVLAHMETYLAPNKREPLKTALTVWWNDGQGQFSDSGQWLSDALTKHVALGDLDGDGDLDLFQATFEEEPDLVWLNDGQGRFADSGQKLGRSRGKYVVLGDLDGDADLDAYVAGEDTNPGVIYFNDGQGHFTDSGQRTNAGNGGAVILADLDGDSDLDVLDVTGSSPNPAPDVLWLNDGHGRFTKSDQEIGVGWGTGAAAGDFDGDGALDLFLATYRTGPNELWLNDSRVFPKRNFPTPVKGSRVVAVPDSANARPGSSPPPAKAPFDAQQTRAHQEAWAKHFGTPVEMTNGVGAKMILIPPGEFLMGAPDDDPDAQPHEKPQHKVRLTKPFYIAATEVTVGQFRKFVEDAKYMTQAESDGQGAFDVNPKQRHPANVWSGLETSDAKPVRCVSWEDANRFCEWLGQQDDRVYRLPTEAEWEFACRAGTATRYSFGNDFDYAQANASKPGITPLRPVGQYPANPFGLSDMHGNLHEICWDSGRSYSPEDVVDPVGPVDQSKTVVVRGGAISTSPNRLRSSQRFLNDNRAFPETNFATAIKGFRVVAAAEAAKP